MVPRARDIGRELLAADEGAVGGKVGARSCFCIARRPGEVSDVSGKRMAEKSGFSGRAAWHRGGNRKDGFAGCDQLDDLPTGHHVGFVWRQTGFASQRERGRNGMAISAGATRTDRRSAATSRKSDYARGRLMGSDRVATSSNGRVTRISTRVFCGAPFLRFEVSDRADRCSHPYWLANG